MEYVQSLYLFFFPAGVLGFVPGILVYVRLVRYCFILAKFTWYSTPQLFVCAASNKFCTIWRCQAKFQLILPKFEVSYRKVYFILSTIKLHTYCTLSQLKWQLFKTTFFPKVSPSRKDLFLYSYSSLIRKQLNFLCIIYKSIKSLSRGMVVG